MRRLPYCPIPVLVLLVESSAIAAPPPAEPPEPHAQEQMREQAVHLVSEGQIAEARDVHLSLWRVGQHPVDAFNVGMLSRRIRDYPTAAEHLTLWLDLVGSPDAKDRQKHARARVDLEEARKHVGALQVNVSDPGAEVSVDGRRVGLSPLKYPVFVWPGQHRVSAQLGGARKEELVSATADGHHTVRLVLPSTPAPATSTATTPPRAGGARRAPLATAPASKPDPWARWLPVGGLTATSVALGIFGGLAVGSANNAADERDAALQRVLHESVNGCPGGAACGNFTAADGRAKTWTGLAVAGFVGAGLSAAGAVGVYVLTPSSPVQVRLAPSGALVAVW